MTLFFTSVTLYLSEAGLFWLFVVGLWECVKWAVGRWIVWPGDDYVVIFPRVTESFLRRFALFQIVFVAVWSILFKAVLYVTLRHSTAHGLLSRSQSLGIAIPAECLLLVFMLVGLWWATCRAVEVWRS